MLSKAFSSFLLLVISNGFMTYAWYGHLRMKQVVMWQAILLSWGIAFFEYCFQVPANRISYGALSGYQLKILQEGISLSVFILFAFYYLGEPLKWKYLVSLSLIALAVCIAFSDIGGK
jgi:uncharacterized protein